MWIIAGSGVLRKREIREESWTDGLRRDGLLGRQDACDDVRETLAIDGIAASRFRQSYQPPGSFSLQVVATQVVLDFALL